MSRRRSEASGLLLFLLAALASTVHGRLADWLPQWIRAPVRRLVATQPKMVVAAPQTTCESDVQTCPNGMVMHRQPELNCKFPDCPAKAWKVYCDPDCDGKDLCKQHCDGTETQSIACPGVEKCANHQHVAWGCTPKDCALGEWTEWAVEGCTGLCNRTRSFTPNECGGTPCVGRLHETMWCASPCNPSVDCALSDWAAWGACDSMGMAHRMRVIIKPSSGGGSPCHGSLEDVRSCRPTAALRKDCTMNDWMAWSGCSLSCGGGQSRRIRGIKSPSEYGGDPCAESSLMETRSCNMQKCSVDMSQATDCQMGAWTAWTGCETGTGQRTRSRTVLRPAAHGGWACNSSLEEVGACQKTLETPVPCELDHWQDWQACDKTCDRGQTNRIRAIKTNAKHGGALCQDNLMETRVCNSHSCAGGLLSGNCKLSSWGEWSACSESCGQGIEKRTRLVKSLAVQGGRGCAEPVAEIRGCLKFTPCAKTDCEWADWTHWSMCSRSCGTGKRSRSRSVKHAPTGGGEACDPLKSTLELEPCNDFVCKKECIDGAWGDWNSWSVCTRTCGGGASWRHRSIAKQANDCGNPANGSTAEFQECKPAPCSGDFDCKVKEWSDWGSCSKTCGGSQTRARTIEVNASGAGKPCENDLTQLRSCDGSSAEACGTSAVDCKLEDWGAWSDCSATCETGQRKRNRKVLAPSRNGGKHCSDSLTETGGCNSKVKCDKNVKDCLYSSWSEWGECDKCDGERLRHRTITQQPVKGVECDPGAMEEVGSCERTCGKKLYYCVWDEWTNGPCVASCGKSSRMKVRTLKRTSKLPENASDIVSRLHEDFDMCNGTQKLHEACDQKSCPGQCKPKDCKFSQWTEWQHHTDCNGLCSRSRSIEEHSNECGASCNGPSITTKACYSQSCEPKQCTFSKWSAWNKKSCKGEDGQKYRSRDIIAKPENGGVECSGSTKQTASCNSAVPDPVACVLGSWGEWDTCVANSGKSCGRGTQRRNRVVATPAAHDGQPCSGTMEQIQPCHAGHCPETEQVDCQWKAWSPWFGCKNALGDQAYRERMIMKQAKGGGKPCSGSLKETGKCPPPFPIACHVGHWDSWGKCDLTCGGGQKFRTREIKGEAKNGGAACVEDLHETAPCNSDPCPSATNCLVSAWASWLGCNPTCGQGVKSRKRSITQPPADGAAGCTLDLVQAESCKNSPCPGIQDCEFSVWNAWSACKNANGCGVGYRERTRTIAKGAGTGGHPCAEGKLMEAIADPHCPGNCNEHCVDGKWDAWQQWSACSTTCGPDGQRSRTRVAKPGTYCGKPAEGDVQEFAHCPAQAKCPGHVDCEWSPWGPWEKCSASCHGAKSRSRTVLKHAARGGRPCHGATNVMARCNPSEGNLVPAGCPHKQPAVDCVLSSWSSWSSCSRPCEGGYKTRDRTVKTPPAHGGEDCDSSLKEIRSCNSQPCPKKKSEDCIWGDWQPWADCDARVGSKARVRDLKVKAVHGLDCEGASKEVAPCTSTCKTTSMHYCVWSLWSTWSPCSKTCGPEGRMTRFRKLAVTRETPQER